MAKKKKTWISIASAFAFVVSFPSALLEFLRELNRESNRSWTLLIAIVLFFMKLRRDRIYDQYNRDIKTMLELLMKERGLTWPVDSSPATTPFLAKKSEMQSTLHLPASIIARSAGLSTNSNMRRKKKTMNKYLNPSFITVIIGVIVPFLNAQFGWNLSATQIAGILITIGSFAVSHEIVVAKKKAIGVFAGYTLNSSKLIVTVIVCLIIGAAKYLNVQADPVDVYAFVATAVGYLTGRGYHDVKQAQTTGNGGVSIGTQTYTDLAGPSK